MDSNELQEYWNTLDNFLVRNTLATIPDKVGMLQAQIMISQVEQLEKLNAMLEEIRSTLAHKMTVATIQG